MADWTDEEELLGRKAFDLWRFTEAPRAIPWDWADMGRLEKYDWIELARGRNRAMMPGHRAAPTARARRAS